MEPFPRLRRLLKKISQHIVCPRCHAKFADHQPKRASFQRKALSFIAQCPECSANVQVRAKMKAQGTMKQEPQKPITEEAVSGISDVLKGFTGDVRNLWKKDT